MDQNALVKVVSLVRELSYREGDFTLSSGKKSKFYIDLKAMTLHPEGAYWIGEAALDLLRQNSSVHIQDKIKAVGGLTLGADPLATSISLAARTRGLHWPAYIVRKEPKSHGTAQYIEGTENIPKGSSVLVLEDVVTTGASSIRAIERLRDAGYNPLATLTVVDRQEGGAEAIRKTGVELLSLTTLEEIQKKAN